MATTDERLDALETRVHSMEEMRLAYEARLIAHDRLLQAATTNDSAHLIELRNLRTQIEQLDGTLRSEIDAVHGEIGHLHATTAAGFDAMAQLIRRGLDLPDD